MEKKDFHSVSCISLLQKFLYQQRYWQYFQVIFKIPDIDGASLQEGEKLLNFYCSS